MSSTVDLYAPAAVIETFPIMYEHGRYFRRGDRIYLSRDVPPPAGIMIVPDSKRLEWYGVSYRVVGWGSVTHVTDSPDQLVIDIVGGTLVFIGPEAFEANRQWHALPEADRDLIYAHIAREKDLAAAQVDLVREETPQPDMVSQAHAAPSPTAVPSKGYSGWDVLKELLGFR